jgi:hypothetical protein
MGMTFKEAANLVCSDLPEGWQIRVELEKDAGNIVLENPWGDTEDFPANHECFEQTLLDAIEHAKSEDVFYVRGPLPGQLSDSRFPCQ